MANVLRMLSMTFAEPWFGTNTIPDADLTGRTVLVTGANCGLGLESAIHFARLSPARLILAVRTPSTGETAKSRIVAETSLPASSIEVWQLDLSSFASVVAFGKKANDELDRLDIAVLNAAIGVLKFEKTEDGWEKTLQVNDIATGLQATTLLPLLIKTAELPTPAGATPLKPHLTIIASDVHYVAAFSERKSVPSKHARYLDALNDPSIFNSMDRYNTSKLVDVFLAREFAKLVKGKVVVTAVNPGLTKSNLRREMGGVIERVLNVLGRDTSEAAKVYVWGSIVDTDEFQPEGGAFVSLSKVQAPSAFVLSEEGREVSGKVFEEMKSEWKKIDGEAYKRVFE